MQEAELPRLLAQVLSLAFVFAVAFGAIAQRTHFCTMGAVADIVNLGDWARMRMWLLAIGVATLGFNALVALGWVQAQHTVYAAPRLLWLSHSVGGLMFGFGMVLASGCGSKTLVRIGGGNLKSLVVFVVLGIAAYTLDWLMLFSDKSKLLTIGIVAALGLVVGSVAVALLQRSFRWEGFGGIEDTANHLVGALLMGVGGITALGCTVGQGLSGVSTLSLGSYLSVAAIVGGAVAALRYQVWRLEHAL